MEKTAKKSPKTKKLKKRVYTVSAVLTKEIDAYSLREAQNLMEWNLNMYNDDGELFDDAKIDWVSEKGS